MAPVRFRSVFTPAGAAVLIIALVILARSLYARNSYEILLSSAALLFLLALGIAGAWRAKKLQALEPGWKPPFPLTANAREETLITGMGNFAAYAGASYAGGGAKANAPLFFRLHFIVKGRFYPCGLAANAGGAAKASGATKANGGKTSLSGQYFSAETSVPRGEDTARLEFNFPMSGIFIGDGYCRLRDIFGFFSFSCGITQRKTLNIRSAPCFGANFYINAQSGAEDRRNKSSNDEERYYMREYAPGDRFRDINWKSSEKIDTLITRISPDNQEKVSRIEVYFRNYGPNSENRKQTASVEALWLLDRAKARLSRFLRSLKEEQSSYVFQIRTAAGIREVKDQDELEAFLDELAGISFSAPVNETNSANPGSMHQSGEIYVFSTSCDIGLPAFLLACQPRPVSLFLTQVSTAAQPKQAARDSKAAQAKTETLRIRDFPANGCVPRLMWFFPGKIKPVGVTGGRLEINYAETRL